MPAKLVVLACFWLNLAYADYISQFGTEILAASDLIIKGVPIERVSLPGGGSVVRARIVSVCHGRAEIGQEVYLCYQTNVELAKNEETVWFLASLQSASSFRVIGEFSLKEKEAKEKLRAFEKLQELERIPDIKIRKKSYVEYCLNGLGSSESWTRMHAFREWRHLMSLHREAIEEDAIEKLRGLSRQIPELDLRQEIQRDLSILQERRKKKVLPAEDWTAELPGVRQALLKQALLKSPNLDDRIKALQVLALLPGPEAEEAFIAALNDESVHIRAQAAFYIGFHRYRNAIPALLHALHEDPSLRVRKNAILALGELQAIEAAPKIRRYLDLPYTHGAAQIALKKLCPSETK